MKNGPVRLQSILTSFEKLTLEEDCCISISSAAPPRKMMSRLRVRTHRKSGQRWDSADGVDTTYQCNTKPQNEEQVLQFTFSRRVGDGLAYWGSGMVSRRPPITSRGLKSLFGLSG